MAKYQQYRSQGSYERLSAIKVFGFTVLLLLIPAFILWGKTFFMIANFSGISMGSYNRTYGEITGFLFFGMPVIGLVTAGIASRVITLLFKGYSTLSAVILNSVTTGGILIIVHVVIITLNDLSHSV